MSLVANLWLTVASSFTHSIQAPKISSPSRVPHHIPILYVTSLINWVPASPWTYSH